MRKKLLGTIAAVAAGAGAAFGQAPASPVPAPPAAIAPLGMYGDGLTPATHVDPVPPPVGGFPGGDPMGFPGGMPGGDPSGAPGYPPPGLYGQPRWEQQTPRWATRPVAPHMWWSADYLLNFVKSQPAVVPFVTTSAPGDGGIPGAPTTRVLHSTSDMNYNVVSGFRVSGGFFCDSCQRWGVEATGFAMQRAENNFFASSDLTGQPLLARPFLSAASGTPAVLTVSFPNYASGNVRIVTDNRTWGADGGPIVNILRSCPGDKCLYAVNLTTGFQYLEVDENLDMISSSTLRPGSSAVFDGKTYLDPAQIGVNDNIHTLNRFYGGAIGASAQFAYCNWMFSFAGKVGLGVMNQRVDIQGTSTLTDLTRGFNSTVPGGLFANSTNSGRFNNDEFTAIPQVSALIGYNWTSWFSTTIGYNGLYTNRVVRPGSQFATSVNPAVVPTSPSYGFGAAVPVANPLFTQEEFWIQGVTFGFQLRY